MAGSTIPYAAPIAMVPGSIGSDPIIPLTASSHVKEADVVALSGGTISPAAANASGSIAGIAQNDSLAVYQQDDTGLQGVFGADNVGTGLLPANAGQTLVLTLKGIPVQMNLSSTTGWISGGSQQANIGTQVGIAIDGTTGFYYADPTGSNKVAQVTEKIEGPGFGGAGDLGARVLVVFFDTALAPLQGL